jgi:hypothetical protein
MPTIINCPGCARELRVPDHLRGREVQCPTCGTRFAAVPPSSAPTESYPESPLPRREPPPEPQPAFAEDEDDPYYDQGRPSRRRRLDLDPHRGGLILTLGILSLVLPCGGLVLGIIAWVLGHNDLAAMRAGTMDPGGRENTNAGRILGMVCCGLHLAGCLFYAMFFGAFGIGFMRFRI